MLGAGCPSGTPHRFTQSLLDPGVVPPSIPFSASLFPAAPPGGQPCPEGPPPASLRSPRSCSIGFSRPSGGRQEGLTSVRRPLGPAWGRGCPAAACTAPPLPPWHHASIRTAGCPRSGPLLRQVCLALCLGGPKLPLGGSLWCERDCALQSFL